MKTWQSVLLGFLAGIVITPIVMLSSQPPRGTAVVLQPMPTPAPILVQVEGAVLQPGVYSLPRGSRVQAALDAAGGMREDAVRAKVNLAAPLKDGEKLVIPTPGAVVLGNAVAGSETDSQAASEVSFPIDLNSATLEELDELPGIGPTRAQQIIDFRDASGGFEKLEDLKDVPGIGDVTFERLKDLVMIQGVP